MVISVGLPLLIVSGKFHSLNSLTIEDLETFIPFMVKCSVNKAGAQLVNGVPEWWASIIGYKFPLKRPSGLSEIGYHKHLCSIVCRCYWYHNAEYLLPFSAKVAENPDSIFLRTNGDNTTSIFYAHNNVHIMRFSNENFNYDAKPKKNEKPIRRTLLPSLPSKKISIPDIYLCENCGAEFSSCSEIQKHEKECYEIVIDDDDDNDEDDDDVDKEEEEEESSDSVDCGGNSENEIDCLSEKDESEEDIEILEHIKPGSNSAPKRDEIFKYLGIQTNENKLEKSVVPVPTLVPDKSKCTCFMTRKWGYVDQCIHKNRNIEFSSDIGRRTFLNFDKLKLRISSAKNISYYETYCAMNPRNLRDFRDPIEYKVTFRRGKRMNWYHHYSYGRKQRKDKYKQLRRGLSVRTWRLLKVCKEVRIVLHRINVSSEKYR